MVPVGMKPLSVEELLHLLVPLMLWTFLTGWSLVTLCFTTHSETDCAPGAEEPTRKHVVECVVYRMEDGAITSDKEVISPPVHPQLLLLDDLPLLLQDEWVQRNNKSLIHNSRSVNPVSQEILTVAFWALYVFSHFFKTQFALISGFKRKSCSLTGFLCVCWAAPSGTERHRAALSGLMAPSRSESGL